MRLTQRRLNRTLLHRQRLLERVDATPQELVEHLIGLQAQENLPPYLSLAARLQHLDPHRVSAGLRDRSLVRLVVMRGTIHLLTADDALQLRRFTQPALERERKASQTVRSATHLERAEFARRLSEVLVEPMPMKQLGEALAAHYPDVPPGALAQLARLEAPLVQTPPRGCWKQRGGVVLAFVDRWTGRAQADPDVEQIVRRYLAAYGPASAADVTAWSGVTRLGPVLRDMDDLVRHEDADGRTLYDVPDGELADEDAHAPVRLLGSYDNVWLSHAQRDRVTDTDKRRRWMAMNGGVASALFVDGWLEGLWRLEHGRVRVVDLFRELTRRERAELDDEITRVETLLAR